jgi:hypothetical protein
MHAHQRCYHDRLRQCAFTHAAREAQWHPPRQHTAAKIRAVILHGWAYYHDFWFCCCLIHSIGNS